MAESSEDLLSQGPPAGPAEDSGSSPIGVPKGFMVPRRTGGYIGTPFGAPRIDGRRLGLPAGPDPMPPRYYKGDELEPARWSVERRVRLQEAMVQAGVYQPNDKFRVGGWDKKTASRWQELLTFANASGLTWQEALSQYGRLAGEYGFGGGGAGGGGGGGGGGGRAEPPPLTVRLTNPDDIVALTQQVAQEALGRQLDDDQARQFASQFQAMEQANQQALHGATYGGGGTVTDVPSLQTAAKSFVENAAPVESDAYDLANQYRAFSEIIEGPGLT